jgi:hypothetical protein
MVTLNDIFISEVPSQMNIYSKMFVSFHDGIHWRLAGTASTKIIDNKLFADIEISNPAFDLEEVYTKPTINKNTLYSILLVNPKDIRLN